MTYINEHYLKLTAGYLFPEIGRRVQAFCDANPCANVIRLGIGDVTEPLATAVIQAMHAAVDELAERSSFRGYGPEQGYDFLREAIAEDVRELVARHSAINAGRRPSVPWSWSSQLPLSAAVAASPSPL